MNFTVSLVITLCVRVGQFEQHLVRARFQADHDHCFAAGVDKVPRQVVDGKVDMADARRHFEGAFAEHRRHAQVLRPRYWMKTSPRASGSGSGGSTISLAGPSFSMATNGDGPRMSLALWAEALVANRVQAAMAFFVRGRR